MRRCRRAALCAAVALLPACGGEDGSTPPREPPRIVTEQVGRGAQSAFTVRQEGDRPRSVVLFLHGWGATLPRSYRPWLDHLARAGNVVIYPRYQDSVLSDPALVLANLLAGVRLALPRAGARRGSLVAVGHSAGGALAADYAAIAPEAGLPVPSAILALYPGRTLRGIAARIPEIPPGRIPAATRIVALAGADDRVVGTAPARRVAASASRVPRARRTYELIRDPAVDDHLGPQRSGRSTRRVFWRRLDALLDEARR